MSESSCENPTIFDHHRYPSHVQLRQLFKASRNIIVSIDLAGGFVSMSGAFRKTLGYLPEEIIGIKDQLCRRTLWR